MIEAREPIRVALLGCGTVGSEVLRLLQNQPEDFAARTGAPVQVTGVAVRRPDKHPEVPEHLLTTDASALVDGDVDVVVELIGGIEPARSLLLRALKSGKSVVTANKALIARAGTRLAALAERHDAALNFEAAIGGAIPIVKTLREGFAGNDFERVYGILNGTCNYILTEMTVKKLSFEAALKAAQALGYAEADPSFDIEGTDSAHKVALLASLCYGRYVDYSRMSVDGITTRIHAYADHGYFAPHELHVTLTAVRRAPVSHPSRILRTFVERYAR